MMSKIITLVVSEPRHLDLTENESYEHLSFIHNGKVEQYSIHKDTLEKYLPFLLVLAKNSYFENYDRQGKEFKKLLDRIDRQTEENRNVHWVLKMTRERLYSATNTPWNRIKNVFKPVKRY